MYVLLNRNIRFPYIVHKTAFHRLTMTAVINFVSVFPNNLLNFLNINKSRHKHNSFLFDWHKVRAVKTAINNKKWKKLKVVFTAVKQSAFARGKEPPPTTTTTTTKRTISSDDSKKLTSAKHRGNTHIHTHIKSGQIQERKNQSKRPKMTKKCGLKVETNKIKTKNQILRRSGTYRSPQTLTFLLFFVWDFLVVCFPFEPFLMFFFL